MDVTELANAIHHLDVIQGKIDAGYIDGVRDDDADRAVLDVIEAARHLVGSDLLVNT